MSTLGTNATTSLVGYTFAQGPTATWTVANIAQVKAGILDDINTSHPRAQFIGTGGFYDNGILYVPNRGQLIVKPGDVVAFDVTTGWPILVSKRAIAAGPWTFV